jgi:DNA-binding NtrC family response regulator
MGGRVDEPSTDVSYVTNSGRTRKRMVGARVRVVEGANAPFELVIPAAGVTVGSGSDCDLQLTDPRVSRNHLHLMADAAGFHVRDLGSTNGTMLDGARITNAVVPPGTTLRVGHTALRLLGAQAYGQATVSTRAAFGGLLGRSLAMREVFGVLEAVAAASTTILLEGETGTGKEEVARAVHEESPRKAAPFVAIDCGAIAANLVESEFFGHERGAFTGAVEARLGAFERAQGGTLFLDEVGELPLDLQPRLLRVLESRQVRKLGGSETRRIDVRVIAATNRDLEEMVAAGDFRADLYYRLAVIHVELPPLRARLDDLPLLLEKFLGEAGLRAHGPIAGSNLDLLAAYAWPGNVRELRNAVQRAIACAGADQPSFAGLSFHLGGRTLAGRGLAGPSPLRVDLAVPFVTAKEQLVDAFERAYLEALLQATEGNVSEASRRSELNRRHLYDLLKKHGLRA